MKNKLFKIFKWLFVFGLISGIGVYLYVFHKPHRDISNEKAAYIVNATDLLNEFTEAEIKSNEKYGDQVLIVEGTLIAKSVTPKGAELTMIDNMNGVSISIDSIDVVKYKDKLDTLELGSVIKCKGKCDGYDMIMGVVLTRCVLTN